MPLILHSHWPQGLSTLATIDEGLLCIREAMIWTGDNKTAMLAMWNVICIGAESFVTSNIAVELNVANGSKVIVKEVVPHPLDHQGWQEIQHNAVVKLSRPPITVFVDIVPISTEPPMEFNYHPRHPTWFPIFPVRQRVKVPWDSEGIQPTRCDNIPPYSGSPHSWLLRVRLPCPGSWTCK